MAGGDNGVSSDEINAVAEQRRTRVVPRARHRLGGPPPVAARTHYQDVTEHSVLRLRLPAENVDRSAVDRRTGGAARLDGRAFAPTLRDRIIDVAVSEINPPTAPADCVELSV